jgi:hypothetical protein
VKRQIITLTLGLAAAPVLVAQQPAHQQAQQQQQMQSQQALHMQQRMQETSQRMERTMTQIRDMNQWMAQRQTTCEACRQMGRDMEQAGDRVSAMIKQLDQLHKDPAYTGAQDRLRDMDRLHDRLRDMIHQLDDARESLRLLAGK